MLVLPIERPATGFVFSFKNCPAVTDLLMCRKYWRQRKKILDLYYYRHSLFFFFFWRRRQGCGDRKVHKSKCFGDKCCKENR